MSDTAETHTRVAESARQFAPVVWLLGKVQSGKTSIIRTLTQTSTAEIGSGFAPCTRTSRVFDFPAEAPIIRFLDTRGLGEVAYDPAEDIAFPYIGPATVVGTLGVVGLLTFPTLGKAFIAPLVYVVIVTVEGQFLTPAIMGRRLELNPFAVFLAIAFCTWLWGPIGAFLAVPLLMALTVALGHTFGEEKPDLPE